MRGIGFLIIYLYSLFNLIYFSSYVYCSSANAFQIVSPSSDRLKMTFNGKFDSHLMNSEEEQPISIISILGTRFSGKSSLLNAILSDAPSFEQKRFEIGSIASGTNGLYLIRSNLKAKDGSVVYFMDSEGLFANSQSKAFDSELFAISALLSSHMIFNSMRTISKNEIEFLELAAKQTKLFQLKTELLDAVESSTADSSKSSTDSEKKKKEIDLKNSLLQDIESARFPPLSWVVRDYVDSDGFDAAKWLSSFMDQTAAHINLRDEFNNGLYVETLPTHTNLEYKQQIRKFKQHLLENTKSRKTHLGTSMTLDYFRELISFLISQINSNQFPKTPTLWNAWVKNLTETAIEDSYNLYKAESTHHANSIPPHSVKDFADLSQAVLKNSTGLFSKMLSGLEELSAPSKLILESRLADLSKHMGERHQHLIREYLYKQKHQMSSDMTSKANSISLPIASDLLHKNFSDVKSLLTKSYNSDLAKYKDLPHFSELLSDLMNEVDAKRDSLLLQNNQLLDSILEKANRTFFENYDSKMSSLSEAISPKSFKQHHTNVVKELISKLEETVEPWILKEEIGKHKIVGMKSLANTLFEEYANKNDKKISDLVKSAFSDAEKELIFENSKFSIPDEPDNLSKRSKSISDLISKSLHDKLSQFTETNHFTSALKEFKNRIEDEGKELLKRSANAEDNVHRPVLVCLKKAMENKSFLSGWIPFLFDREARAAGRECFEKEGKLFGEISDKRKNAAINGWIESKFERPLWSKLVGALFILTSLISGAFIFARNKLFTKQRTTTGEARPKIQTTLPKSDIPVERTEQSGWDENMIQQNQIQPQQFQQQQPQQQPQQQIPVYQMPSTYYANSDLRFRTNQHQQQQQ